RRPESAIEELRRAIADLDKAVELVPTDARGHAYRARGHLCSIMNQYGKARADFGKAIASGETSWTTHYCHALHCPAAGDPPRYRKDCAEMLKQCGQSENPYELRFTAWTCALAPDAVDAYGPVLELTRRAVKHCPDDRQALQGLGTTLFRAGQAEEALKYL